MSEDLEQWLARRAGDLLDGEPVGPHLADERLAQVAEGRGSLRGIELEHLAGCPVCRDVAAALVEAVPARTAPRRRWWLPLIPLGAMLGAGALMFFFLRANPPEEGYRARGGEAAAFAAPSLTIQVEDRDGRRVLVDGATVRLNGRLAFRYGNAGNHARTLTVLGWDGEQVHWYYPEGPGKPPQDLLGGAGAVGQRLPFDVVLDAPHKPGPLTIVYGFDQNPNALAKTLQSGQSLAGVQGLKIILVERAR